ncbi:MAG TPA: STAS domain-containing protein [Lachnospiraceae bacterium]|nr:STAS domain-containing protein [Lachnospiraceae bacterium]HPF29174.1 STAS domain-containing protein [Lachnospiraceae bacterium]
MNITKTREEGKLTVKLEGRLDTSTAPELERELGEALDNVTDLTLDFAELAYISSAGLRVLLTTQKRMNKQGNMVIQNANDDVKEVFEVTGFIDILTVE